jgi:diadenylate cyclase
VGKRPPVQEERLIQALQMIAPGTAIREAIDNIVKGRHGALLVFSDEEKIRPMISGGISIDVAFAPMLLYELAKMDGAILLNETGSRILHANVQLMPDARIWSQETGTRHRTAERVAKQIDALAISISAARDVVTVYVGDIRYVLEPIRTILDRADQALQTMEKFRSRFDHVASDLSLLELRDAVTLHEVLTVLQRAEMVLVIAQLIEGYLIQLGAEGRLVELQLEELLVNVRDERALVLADYLPEINPVRLESARAALGAVPSDELLSLSRIAEALGFEADTESLEKPVHPRGFRMLRKIPRLTEDVIDKVVCCYGELRRIREAPLEELAAIEGLGPARAQEIKAGLARLAESIAMERRS